MSTTYLDILATKDLTGGEDTRYLAPGTQTEADVLINALGDGTDLDVIYRELLDITASVNAYKGGLARLLTFWTDRVAEAVPQSMNAEKFEPATEFGLPAAVGQDPSLLLGFGFGDHDLRSSFTWKYLRGASADQVRNAFVRVLEADSNLVVGTILRRLFDPAEQIEEQWGHVVRGLWTGSDGLAPLPYLGKTFATNHTHYLASGATQIDSLDVEDCMNHVTEHGYGKQQGSQLLILANPVQSEQIQAFRAGKESRPSGPLCKFDFIPGKSAPPYLTDQTIVGAAAPESFNGLEILGSYGRAWLLEHELIPVGYFAVVATGGLDSPNNPIAFREHENPSYRGMRIIPGYRTYPIIDSYFQRSFGVGTRHRGAAVCMQITSGSTYTAPTINI